MNLNYLKLKLERINLKLSGNYWLRSRDDTSDDFVGVVYGGEGILLFHYGYIAPPIVMLKV